MKYGWYKPQPYWNDHIMNYTNGELFNIISNGINSMPGYSKQIKEEDRWAIVTYIRALQASNKMNIEDIRKLNNEDLIKEKESVIKNIMDGRFKHKSMALSDTSQIQKLKRDKAKILTVINERKIVGTTAITKEEIEEDDK